MRFVEALDRLGKDGLHRLAVNQAALDEGEGFRKAGAIKDLALDHGILTAQVQGARATPYTVTLASNREGELFANCDCGQRRRLGTICAHGIAVILEWIARRDGRRSGLYPPLPKEAGNGEEEPVAEPTNGSAPAEPEAARPEPARPAGPRLRDRRGGRPGPSRPPVADDEPQHDEIAEMSSEPSPGYRDERGSVPAGPSKASDWLRTTLGGWLGSGNLRIEADWDGPGPALRVRVRLQGMGRELSLRFPPQEAPGVLEALRRTREVRQTRRLSSCRLHHVLMRAELRGELDGSGVYIRAVYVQRGPGGERTLASEAVRRRLCGEGWYWDGHDLWPVAPVPVELRPYFEGTSQRRFPGELSPTFLESDDFRKLSKLVLFKPSPSLKKARVLHEPAKLKLNVEEGGEGWLWLDPIYRVGDHTMTLKEILELPPQGQFVRKGDDWIALGEDDPRKLAERAGGKIEGGRLKVPSVSYLKLKAEWGARAITDEESGVKRFAADLDRLQSVKEMDLPKGLKSKLRPYQKFGYDWMWFLRETGLHGLLADEMGLGKTHQTMAFLCNLYENKAKKPSLVVCPTSVLDHWEEKLKEYAPELTPVRYHGAGRAEKALDEGHVVLTTYSLLVRDAEALGDVDWECVVLDEAQKIKNAETQTAQAARRLKSRTRIALSGTPLENRPAELWSIFEFLMPSYLGKQGQFLAKYEAPILRGDKEAAETLRRVIRPFMLRRTKSEVMKDLPPKVEDVYRCELSDKQQALYRAVLSEQKELVRELKAAGKPANRVYPQMLAALTKLKQVCDHPTLILGREDEAARELESGKFELFKELLEEALDSGQKVVVFSQYLGMMDIIEEHLKKAEIDFEELRGETKERGAAIKRFQEDENCRVFVGSLLAGGLGIDLTAASVVIHYDRWWNPAREAQATDRVHRIGQQKNVQVLKLITRGTIEEKIDRLLSAKTGLASTVVTSDEGFLQHLTAEDLAELLT